MPIPLPWPDPCMTPDVLSEESDISGHYNKRPHNLQDKKVVFAEECPWSLWRGKFLIGLLRVNVMQTQVAFEEKTSAELSGEVIVSKEQLYVHLEI